MYSICLNCWIDVTTRMGKNNLTEKSIDILQWVMIIALFALLIIQGIGYKSVRQQLVKSEEYNKENTYIRIYESQKLDKLKKENKELYDSIAKLSNVESGMIIKFIEHYKTDTIYAEKFKIERDTIFKTNEIVYTDSIYHYTQTNDTIDCDIKVKAKDLQWCMTDISIRDKFVIINREKDGVNQTSIDHSGNTTIEGTAMWHKENKRKWYQRFTVGPQVGLGFGTLHKDFDIYVGLGVGYDF